MATVIMADATITVDEVVTIIATAEMATDNNEYL
jgi:hypothetical protein